MALCFTKYCSAMGVCALFLDKLYLKICSRDVVLKFCENLVNAFLLDVGCVSKGDETWLVS